METATATQDVGVKSGWSALLRRLPWAIGIYFLFTLARLALAYRMRLPAWLLTLEASRRLHGRSAKHSLDVVCERELGIRLDKGQQTSEWCRRPLSEAQIRYAALDAEVLVDLHQALKDVEPLLL